MKYTYLSLFLIIILGFVVYSNSLNGKFIWDDTGLVRDNVYIRNWSDIYNIFSKDIGLGNVNKSNSYRPLQMLTYTIDYSLWKLDVFGYHLTNVFLHILAALSVYWLVNILYQDNLLSLFTGLLFVIHPIHTEAVSYISGRADPLATLFMLLCFIFYIKQLEVRSMSLCILTSLTYIFALLSRENSLIIPALLLLYHYTFKNKIRLKEISPILIITSIYILLRLTLLRTTLNNITYHTTILERVPGFFAAITRYLRLIFVPFNLHMEYGNKVFGFSDPAVIFGIAISLFLLIYAFRKRNTSNLLFFCILWFFITLLPQSNLYPVNAYMAEHWLYLPSIGFFLVLARGISSLYRTKPFRICALILLMGLLAVYSWGTVRQNSYWKEPIVFYERILKYVKDSPRIYNNLGIEYSSIAKYEEAIALYKKAIEIRPDYIESYNNLVTVYNKMGREKEALAVYKKAIEVISTDAEACNNLANHYNDIGKIEEAIALYNKAIEINPNYARAHLNLSIIYFRVKEYDLAITHCDTAIKLGYKVTSQYLDILKPYRKISSTENRK